MGDKNVRIITRGKGLFHAREPQPPAEVVDAESPFLMTTGRVYAHYHTGTMTGNSKNFDFEVPERFLEIHPGDAEKFEICDGYQVRMASRRGEIITKIMITECVEAIVAFMPSHFEEANVNKLTNPACDPIAKIPELKVCAVKPEKVKVNVAGRLFLGRTAATFKNQDHPQIDFPFIFVD